MTKARPECPQAGLACDAQKPERTSLTNRARHRILPLCPSAQAERFYGGRSSMVELRFVVPAVAGSSPVDHPTFFSPNPPGKYDEYRVCERSGKNIKTPVNTPKRRLFGYKLLQKLPLVLLSNSEIHPDFLDLLIVQPRQPAGRLQFKTFFQCHPSQFFPSSAIF